MSTESQEPSAGGPAMSSAWPIAGAKAAKKAIPASFYGDEPLPAVEGEVDVRVDADPEGLNLEVGEGDPEQPQVEVQDIPLENPQQKAQKAAGQRDRNESLKWYPERNLMSICPPTSLSAVGATPAAQER